MHEELYGGEEQTPLEPPFRRVVVPHNPARFTEVEPELTEEHGEIIAEEPEATEKYLGTLALNARLTCSEFPIWAKANRVRANWRCMQIGRHFLKRGWVLQDENLVVSKKGELLELCEDSSPQPVEKLTLANVEAINTNLAWYKRNVAEAEDRHPWRPHIGV